MLNERLRAVIGKLPGVEDAGDFEILQCSSQSATGAIIYHVASARGALLAVVKTPRDPAADHAIAVEWDNVSTLHTSAGFGSLVPSPLKCFEIDGATFYAYRAMAGGTMFARYRNRIFASRDSLRARFARQALPVALRLHAAHTRAVDGVSLARDLGADLQALRQLVKHVPPRLEERVAMAADLLARSGLELPMGRIHGDFSPYNLMIVSASSAGCIGIIDWEHSEADRPQHLDVFRFISGAELMGRRTIEGASALRSMCHADNPAARELWQPWLEAMAPAAKAASLGTEAYAALWLHFWVSAAYREQRRQSDPADVSRTTYFSGLCELTAA